MKQPTTAKRDILFVTGTRADFGKLEPLAKEAACAGNRVTFFVTGMHMMARYGLTRTEVHRSGHFDVVEFINQRHGDPQDIVLAKTVMGFSDCLQELCPDLVVTHGDRVEALACSLVCAMNGVRCAHVEGGEVSGTIDEVFRHCNTKLSSAHLVSSADARARVLRLGESSDSVFVIGSPELDVHSKPSGVSLTEVLNRYEIASSEYGICTLHPVTSELHSTAEHAERFFRALEHSQKFFVVILPNNDPGADKIVEVIAKLPQDRFRVLPSMRFIYFSELLRNAQVIVGNSSTGVREAPFLGIPSLDVGSRQFNRTSADSVTKCSPTDQSKILAFLETEWGKHYKAHKDLGVGDAAAHFAALIDDPRFWNLPLQKFFNENR